MESEENLKLGLCLSGGGNRAVVYHSGVLKCLAEKQLLEKVTFISTVSGGSLFTGLVYAIAGNRWPTSAEYLTKVYPQIRELLTTKNLQMTMLFKLVFNPMNWRYAFNRSNILAQLIEQSLNINMNLQDLPGTPCWVINGTNNATGNNWQFARKFMGEKLVGFVNNPDFPVAEAIAVSASFPGLIGRFKLDTTKFEWFTRPDVIDTAIHADHICEFDREQKANSVFKRYYLLDGGMYDNLGSESLFDDFGVQLRKDVNAFVISDAGAPLGIKRGAGVFHLLKRSKRMVDIIYDQIRTLRLRMLKKYLIKNPGKGLIFEIGDAAADLAKLPEQKHILKEYNFMPGTEARKAQAYKTDLSKVPVTSYNLISDNGYENTLAKLKLYPFIIEVTLPDETTVVPLKDKTGGKQTSSEKR